MTIRPHLLLCLLAVAALATSSHAKSKPAPATTKKAATAKKTAPLPPPAVVLPDATPEQADAAGRVYYGLYDCEFKQSVDIVASPKHPHYVDVKVAKADYLMKPVLSSTGAVRLEDVKGAMLMVQIASKSMLMNVKTGQRVVDECISPRQRELIEAARKEKASGGATDSAVLLRAPTPAGAAVETPAAPAATAAAAASAVAP